MTLQVLGSSSSGNGYFFLSDDGSECLLLEVGIRYADYKKALAYRTDRIVGALVTHQHGDHAKYISSLIDAGIRTYALPDVFEASHITSSFAVPVSPRTTYSVGRFVVMPVEVRHDVPCVAWLIQHPEMGRVLFITDTMQFVGRVPGLDHIMIECNYADDILDDNIRTGEVHPSQRQRLMLTHMELETTKAILANHDLAACKNIVLVHISSTNGDPFRFVSEIESVARGCKVHAATRGLVVPLRTTPY